MDASLRWAIIAALSKSTLLEWMSNIGYLIFGILTIAVYAFSILALGSWFTAIVNRRPNVSIFAASKAFAPIETFNERGQRAYKKIKANACWGFICCCLAFAIAMLLKLIPEV